LGFLKYNRFTNVLRDPPSIHFEGRKNEKLKEEIIILIFLES